MIAKSFSIPKRTTLPWTTWPSTEITAAQGLVEQGREVLAGRVQRHIISHKFLVLFLFKMRGAGGRQPDPDGRSRDCDGVLPMGSSEQVARRIVRERGWICHLRGSARASTMRRAASAAWDIVILVVSSKTGSLRPGRGIAAGALGGSRVRRASWISARISSKLTASPAWLNCRYRRSARTSGLAVTNSLAVASGQITVPMSRPSSTAPPACAANWRWKSSRAARAPR